jgi:uncharacterized protein YjbJ (UPF0337 family)
MDTNEIKGATNETIGKVQDVVGSVTGDAGAELAGKAKELGGKVQEIYGQATDQLRRTTTENPLITLAVVGLAGFLLGALFKSANRDSMNYDDVPPTRGRRY